MIHPLERPAGTRRSRAYFPELESLRGLAILLVFLYHADGILLSGAATAPTTGVAPSLPVALVRAGHTGVSLFFVLSGFLLSLPFLAAMAGEPRVAIGNFYRRRALRILPLYWLVVVAATLLNTLATGSSAPLVAGAAALVFLNTLIDFGPALWPYSIAWWSLATEVQFYLLLPLLGVFGSSPPRRRLGLLLLLFGVLAYAAYLSGHLRAASIGGQMRLNGSVVGRAPLFAAGIAAAALYRSRGEAMRAWLARRPLLARGGADLALAACFIGLAMLLRWTLSLAPGGADSRPAWRLAEALCWSGVILALLLAPLRARAVLVNPVFDRLGRWSYSIFLLHVPLLVVAIFAGRAYVPGALTAWTPGSAAVLAAVALVIVAASALTYRFIERPFLVRKARLAG